MFSKLFTAVLFALAFLLSTTVPLVSAAAIDIRASPVYATIQVFKAPGCSAPINISRPLEGSCFVPPGNFKITGMASSGRNCKVTGWLSDDCTGDSGDVPTATCLGDGPGANDGPTSVMVTCSK
ncbi:hypothetical protein EJ06DRAFT_578202 [Trichodelitschia bisporula]|uniref:Uncharacterized protein n=1 Tax=Trichodelitschia bisporula TaxID=703511 RepID=A0A6G1IA44_9PEZI|nr:hypothetical protein EJ06DRAFT_578202 [Trichodelitschia bisporula]